MLYSNMEEIGRECVIIFMDFYVTLMPDACSPLGPVYTAITRMNGQKVVVSKMKLPEHQRQDLAEELLTMKALSHENLINFIDSHIITAAELWLVKEHVGGVVLTDILTCKKMSEDQIFRVVWEVCPAPCRPVS